MLVHLRQHSRYSDGIAKLYFENSEKLTTNTQGIDITGHTETDTLNVSGVSTFVETVKASDRLEVDGVTDLDELTVTGVSTFSGQVGFTTHVDILDDVRLRIGDDQDLENFPQL